MRFQNFVLSEKKYHSGMDFSDVQDSIKGKTLIFFDTETTGLDPNIKYVQITEIAGVAYDDQGNQLDTFHAKIHLTDNVKKVIAWEKKNGKAFAGGRKTVAELLDMTGYYDKNADFGDEIEVLTEFKQWVESFPNPVLIAQNLEFDMKQVGTKVGAPAVAGTHDTLLFARIFMEAIMDSLRGNEDIEKARDIMSVIAKNRWGKEYKKLSHTLDKLGKVFDVKTDMWHSAIADTQQLAGIFFAMLEWYDKHKEELDPEKYGKQLRKKIQKDVGFSKWQKKMQKGDPKKRKDANKAFAQEFGEQTNRDNTHSRDGVNAKLRQHDLKPEQDLNAISHMSRDFGSDDGAWEDVKKESEHEEEELEGLEELFKPYPWSGGRDNEDDMFSDYHFETDDGIKYSAWVDKTSSPDDAPAYEIGFGVKTGGPAADTQVTLNSTDATDVVATVLDIVNNEVDASEFWMVFEPTKDNKGQDASKSKRASLYSRMITRSAKRLGQEILGVKNQGDYVLVKVSKGNEEDLVEMPLRMDQESRPLVAEWAPSKWFREVRWSADLGNYKGIEFVAGKGPMGMYIAIGATDDNIITCMAKTSKKTIYGDEGPEAQVLKFFEIATEPEYRGKGIGKAMHDFCIETFGGVASDHALFETKPGANDGMVGMWTKYLPSKYPCYVVNDDGQIIAKWHGGELDNSEETLLVALKNPAAYEGTKMENRKYRFSRFVEDRNTKSRLKILSESIEYDWLGPLNESIMIDLHEGFLDDIKQSVMAGTKQFQDRRKAAKFQKTANKLVRALSKKLQKTQKPIEKAANSLAAAYDARKKALVDVGKQIEAKGGDIKDELMSILQPRYDDIDMALKNIKDIRDQTKGMTALDGSDVVAGDESGEMNPKAALKAAIQKSNDIDAKKANGILSKIKKTLGNKFGAIYKKYDGLVSKIPGINKMNKKIRDRVVFVLMLNLVTGGLGFALSGLGDGIDIASSEVEQIASEVGADSVADEVASSITAETQYEIMQAFDQYGPNPGMIDVVVDNGVVSVPVTPESAELLVQFKNGAISAGDYVSAVEQLGDANA